MLRTRLVNLEQAGLRGPAAGDRRRIPASARHPSRHRRAHRRRAVGAELLSGSNEDETAWRNGQWYTARCVRVRCAPTSGLPLSSITSATGCGLQVRTPGDLETLELVAFNRVPPGPGQIEVAITASSLNFADVLMAMGRFPTIDEREAELGVDFVGVVTAVGPDVVDHQVGDRVGGFSRNGCWATFVTCDARVAVALPAELTDRQAAAVSTGHATAWYGLHDQARISAGDRVLIHSATGGVGQAAVAIARAAGAEIFATAGSPQRRESAAQHGH